MAQQMLVPFREDVLWGHLCTGSRECPGDAVYRHQLMQLIEVLCLLSAAEGSFSVWDILVE